MWEYVWASLTVWFLFSLSPPVLQCTSLFLKHFFIVHFPFTVSLLSHLANSLFVSSSSSLVALMHSHHPFIHADVLFIKAQHYSTNPTASSFAPLHLPLHHPPPHHNTWSVPGGLNTPSYYAPSSFFTEALEVSLVLIFWCPSLKPYSTENVYTVYIHTPRLLVKLWKLWKYWKCECKNKNCWN